MWVFFNNLLLFFVYLFVYLSVCFVCFVCLFGRCVFSVVGVVLNTISYI